MNVNNSATPLEASRVNEEKGRSKRVVSQQTKSGEGGGYLFPGAISIWMAEVPFFK